MDTHVGNATCTKNRISKHIMNPSIIEQVIRNYPNHETTEKYILDLTGYASNIIQLPVKRFVELGLITPSGSGSFTISKKGLEFSINRDPLCRLHN